jgi:hypothetical protein
VQGNQLFINFDVRADVLHLFISAVHGEAVELTNENIELSARAALLCTEGEAPITGGTDATT